LRKKVRLVTAQPLFVWFKKRKPPIMQKGTILTAGNLLKTETPHSPQDPSTSLECRKWKRWSCYKKLNTARTFFTPPLPTNLLLFAIPASCNFHLQLPTPNPFFNINGEE